MSVFEEHTERLAGEYLANSLHALMAHRKKQAKLINENNHTKWENSLRHKMSLFLNRLALRIDMPEPEHVDWRRLGW